jgi:LysM repeat protein
MALPGWSGSDASRYLAPAVFLLAVTAVVLVVRSALRSDPAPGARTQAAATARATSGGKRPPPPVAKRYYVIRSGDTLEAIARTFSTTVDRLLRLNPGIEPTALVPGHQLRVK